MSIPRILKKIFVFLLFTVISIFYLYDNVSTEVYAKELFAGGEMVYYDLCIVNHQALKVEFPILSASKIKSIKSLKLDDDEAYSKIKCSVNFKPSNIQYKNCYINYFTVIFEEKNNKDSSFSFDIDGFMMTIDKYTFKYRTPHFKLCNSSSLIKNGESLAPITEISRIDESSMVNYIPTKDRLASAYYSISKNLYLINMNVSSFYTIDNCYINGTSYDANNIYTNMLDNKYLALNYSLQYTNTMYKSYMTRSYFTITYQKNCEIKKYISNSEFYISPYKNTNSVATDYIDSEYNKNKWLIS